MPAKGAVLDTHVWVWWQSSPDRLSKAQARALADDKSPLFVSILSAWEVAKLHEKNRVRFSIPLESWIRQALEVERVNLVPLSLDIVLTSTRLSLAGDPVDQMLVATAQHFDVPLVTSDEKIIRSGLVTTIS